MKRRELTIPRPRDMTIGVAVALAEEFGREAGASVFASFIVTGPPEVCDRLRARLRGMRLPVCDGVVLSADTRTRLQVRETERPSAAEEAT